MITEEAAWDAMIRAVKVAALDSKGSCCHCEMVIGPLGSSDYHVCNSLTLLQKSSCDFRIM